MNNTTCTTCFRIACRKCDWVATDEEVLLVQKSEITVCPKCGWRPTDKS